MEKAMETSSITLASTTVFVSKLSPTVTQKDLLDFFSGCGEIEEVKLAVDKKSGKSKCTALVQFKDADSMPAAFALSKSILHGEKISILKSKFPARVERSQGQILAVTNVEKVEITVPSKITLFKPRHTTGSTATKKPPKKLNVSTISQKSISDDAVNSKAEDVVSNKDNIPKGNDFFSNLFR